MIGNNDDVGFSLEHCTSWLLSLTIGSMAGPIMVDKLTYDVEHVPARVTVSQIEALSYVCVFVVRVYCVKCFGVWHVHMLV